MKKPIAVLIALLLLTAVARYHIFRLHEKEIAPEFYERKMKLEDFWLPDKALPAGYSLAPSLPAGGQNPAELEPSELARLPKPRPQFPAPDKIEAAHVAAYTSTLGDQLLLIACEYSVGSEPETTPAGFHKDGPFLVTAAAPTPKMRDTLLDALSSRLAKLKQESVKLNKLKTAGNVLLKLFMDLLVGSFVFMLLLFLAKYFLITKTVEE